jgi:hypothetical protein
VSEFGRVLSAKIEIDGSELATDHAAGVTELDLEDALVFVEPEEGEVLQVRITSEDGLTEEFVTIKVPETDDEITVDDFDGFIQLAAPTVAAFSAGDRVEVWPQTRRLIAHVRLEDDDEDTETVDAIVHHSLYAYVTEGSDLDVAVQLDYDGEDYWVVDLIGQEPEFDGGFLSPGTIEPPALTVGTIRYVESEAELAELEANDEVKFGDVAYVRGEAGLYAFLDTQPTVTTYDATGDPVATPVPPVPGTLKWYRTVDAADILADSITATHLSVETLSAIAADLGEITAGSITGGLFKTADDGEASVQAGRVRIDGVGDKDKILFDYAVLGTYVESGRMSAFGIGGIQLRVQDPTNTNWGTFDLWIGNKRHLLTDQEALFKTKVRIGSVANDSQNALIIRNVNANSDISTPPTGFVAIYFNSAISSVMAMDSAGSVRQLCNTVF